ncbi:hypothetical protein ACHQM5_011381 [Ranunculus cassubicifolius]
MNMIPALLMIFLQFISVGNNVFNKLALDSGMNPQILVAYRQIFATCFLAPTVFFERKTRPTFTKLIFFKIFLSAFFGGVMHQCLYFTGLKHTTPTIACALLNTAPAITFILAIFFRMEAIGIQKNWGKAKVIGTIVCVGGAVIMSFYKGSIINIGRSTLHWQYAEKLISKQTSASSTVAGPIVVFFGVVCFSMWFIIQNNLFKTFPAPYTSTTLMFAMASVLCVLLAVIQDRSGEAWSMKSFIRIGTCLYSGAFASALAFVVTAWCISKRGPLYVSMFGPIALVMVAFFDWALLDGEIYVGSVVGSVSIAIGLYAVLWGKGQEMKESYDIPINFDAQNSPHS